MKPFPVSCREAPKHRELRAGPAVGHLQRPEREAPAAGEPLDQTTGHSVRHLSHCLLRQGEPDGEDAHLAAHRRKSMPASTHTVYLSPGLISVEMAAGSTGVTLYVNQLIKSLLLSFERISLQGSRSVYAAPIMLPALFVLAQGHAGAEQAKSFAVKQSFSNFHIGSRDVLNRFLSSAVAFKDSFSSCRKYNIYCFMVLPDTKTSSSSAAPCV